jgi:SAM-dependent methyltransferase
LKIVESVPGSTVHLTRKLTYTRIGSGTGIFTRALLTSSDLGSSIGELRAFEPVEGMRDQFAKSVSDARVSQAEGAFDRLPNVPDGWADLLVVAQAFHWCPDHSAALKAFARVLKPGAPAALVWNLEDRDAVRWIAQLRDRIESHEGGAPQFRTGAWRAVYDAPEYAELFEPPVEQTWPYVLPTSLERVVDRASSKSYIAVLPETEKAKVQDDVRDILRRGDDLTWINKEEGAFEYPYKSYVAIMRKK